MQDLFVVRHAIYGEDRHITDEGRQQMRVLGRSIDKLLLDKTIHIISSTAPRAIESALVLAPALRIATSNVERLDYLWSGTDSPEYQQHYRDPNPYTLLQIVNEREDKADALVMLTHQEIAEHFPSFYCAQKLNLDVDIGGVKKGQAVHIDLMNKKYEILGRKQA